MRRLVVLSTAPRAEDAEFLARELVDRRLAACVNILPALTSIYRWRGEVERTEEVLMVVKTTEDRFEAVREAIVKGHPYDVPEVIAVEVTLGHAPYLAWLDEGVS
ncbi:MAG TPA: divalent-cation tolerance protein CutA [Vicinamibacteria bacterium]|nr:divalent-cation tolerance protein CutA [Vicinamibacteria bacterium]